MLNLLLTFALWAPAGHAVGGSNDWTFDVEKVSNPTGSRQAIASERASGSDHYQLAKNGTASTFNGIRVARLNASFVHQWNKNIEPKNASKKWEWVPAAMTDPQGNLVILAVSDGQDNRWVYLCKLDRNGNEVFYKRLWISSDAAIATRVAISPSGDIFVSGRTKSESYLNRYSPTGTLLYSKELNFKASDGPVLSVQKLAADSDGRAFLLGKVNGKGALWAFDVNGERSWSKTFNVGATPFFVDLQINAKNRLVATAQLQRTGQAGSVGVWQWKLDGSGSPNFAQIKTLNSMKHSSGYRAMVEHGPNGEVYLAWTDKANATAKIAKVVPPPGANTRRAAVGRRTGKIRMTAASAVATTSSNSGVVWETSMSIGQLRSFTRLKHGGLIVVGADTSNPLRIDESLQARAFTPKGKFVGSEAMPTAEAAQDPSKPPNLEFVDAVPQGDKLFLIGRRFNLSSPSAPSGLTNVRFVLRNNRTAKPKPRPKAAATSSSNRSIGKAAGH